MKQMLLIILLPLTFKQCSGQKGSEMNNIPVKGYALAWSDEFDKKQLDESKWNHRGLGKREDAYNVVEAVSFDEQGNLLISAFERNDSVFTGMISTEGIFETRYGYFECRAKIKTPPGTFPSFWLQSPRINIENGTPVENGAELDIFEYFPHTRPDAVAHTLHYGGYGQAHKVAGPIWTPLKNPEAFHTFGLQWTPDSYTTFVDGVQTFSGTQMISAIPEFMILSLGINAQVAGPLNKKQLPATFIVDYVRVYKPKETNQ